MDTSHSAPVQAATTTPSPVTASETREVHPRGSGARLLKAEQEWQLEREILRRAAAYFAREVK
ncbi:hypothetical protein [Streptomyces mirabilis]|uniref:hypothetical protein n=1 Tax=Streptomyces mirabilis TaxID=68239 RepID=UPI00368FE2BD